MAHRVTYTIATQLAISLEPSTSPGVGKADMTVVKLSSEIDSCYSGIEHLIEAVCSLRFYQDLNSFRSQVCETVDSVRSEVPVDGSSVRRLWKVDTTEWVYS